MERRYDYRSKGCKGGVEEAYLGADWYSIQSVLGEKRWIDSQSVLCHSKLEQERFIAMLEHMQDFAQGQSALLEVHMNKDEGRYVIEAPGICFADILRTDRAVMDYMKHHAVFIRAKGGAVVLEISVIFWKRKKKPNKT